MHIEDRQENCSSWLAIILSQSALPQFTCWVRKEAPSVLKILTGQMAAAASQLLAGHVNGSGAGFNLQAVFCVGLAGIKFVLVFRIF